MIKTLFGFHLGSNPGYAMLHYERMFYRVGLALAEGNPDGMHVSYTNFASGQPKAYPEAFSNYLEFDYLAKSPAALKKICDYARTREIDVAVFFDLDATHPVVGALREAGVKKVMSVWGSPISTVMPAWKLAIKKVQVALSSSRLDCMVFESTPMAYTATHGRGYPASRVRIIRQGVEIDKFKPAPDSDYVHSAFNFPRDRKVIIFTGHMEERKGVRTLVRAAIELLQKRGRRDVAFLICGNKNEEAAPYQKLYEGLGLDEFIRFGGYRSDLPQIYPGCYAGVIPSTGWDSFPYGAIEMQACGLPMLASNLQGLTESVLDGQTGLLFEPGNYEELADKLELLLERPELARTFAAAGRARCETELNVDVQYQKTQSLIREVLAGGVF